MCKGQGRHIEKHDFFLLYFVHSGTKGSFVISLICHLEDLCQMSHGSRSEITSVKVKLGSQTKAGGLKTMSSCFIL